MRPTYFSYSKLTMFSTCRLQYRLAYVEKVKRPGSKFLSFERRLHRALRRFHQHAAQDGLVPVGTLLSSWESIWLEDMVPDYRSLPEFGEGQDILRRYAERENGLGRVAAEMEHEIKLSFGPYFFSGTIDRLDYAEGGGRTLFDYKLDRKLPAGNAAKGNRQLAFYTLLTEHGPGWPVREVRLYYLRHGVEHVHQPTRADLHDTLNWVETTAARIKRERQWKPTEGSHCRGCSYQSQCPLKTNQPRPLAEVWRQGDLEEMF